MTTIKWILVGLLLLLTGIAAFFNRPTTPASTQFDASSTQIYGTVSAQYGNQRQFNAVEIQATRLASEGLNLLATREAMAFGLTVDAEVAARQMLQITISAEQAYAQATAQMGMLQITREYESTQATATYQAAQAQQAMAETATSDARFQIAQATAQMRTATAEAQIMQATATAFVQQEQQHNREMVMYEQEQQMRQFAQIVLLVVGPIFLIGLLIVGVVIALRHYALQTQMQRNTEPIREIIYDNRRVIVLNTPNGPQIYDPNGPALPTIAHEPSLFNDFAPEPVFETERAEVASSDDGVLTALQDEDRIIVYGGSGAGKTALTKQLVAHKFKLGRQVIILDPHLGAPDSWEGYPHGKLIGGGLNYEKLRVALVELVTEMHKRFEKKRPHTPMLIVFDEWRAFVQKVPAAAQMMLELVTAARKVGMGMILISQSRQVKALGIQGEGDLRENFTIVHAQRDGERRFISVEGENGKATYPHPGPFITRPAVKPAVIRPSASPKPSAISEDEPTTAEVSQMERNDWRAFVAWVLICYQRGGEMMISQRGAIREVYNISDPSKGGGGQRGEKIMKALRELQTAGRVRSLPAWMSERAEAVVEGELV